MNRWDDDQKVSLGNTIRNAFVLGVLLGGFTGFLFGMLLP